MAATFTYTPKTVSEYYTVAELNALFTAIKAVVDAKLDARGDTVEADLLCVDSSIINVPEPAAAGDLLRCS